MIPVERIALIDDHWMMTSALQGTLSQLLPGAEVRPYLSANLFWESTHACWKPEIIISDIVMPGMDGLDLHEKLCEANLYPCKFILLSSIQDASRVQAAMRRGVNAFVGKDASIEELMQAIEAVQAGENYVSNAIRKALLQNSFAPEASVNFHFTSREQIMLNLICSGQTPKEIAFSESLSIHTVQEYIRSLLKKCKVNRTTDLVLFALKEGLVKQNH